MKNLTIIIFVLLLISSCKNHLDTTSLSKEGISIELASYRKQQVSNVVYNLSFKIPSEKEKEISSHLALNLNIHSLNQPLYLDFNEKADHLLSLSVNDKNIPINHEKEHLIISPENLKLGENTIKIEFLAGELSLNRNEDFLYTLLVPDRASTLFPCFDQPDIKANYILKITAPKEWKVLCGAKEQEQVSKGTHIEHIFAKTDIMSSYLFSFVAGKFEAITKNPGAFDMLMLYRETNVEKIEASIDNIFNMHQQSIDFLEDYTAYPFPFQKLDFAAIPIFQYGGMEHVGAIQYRESALFLDNTATESQKLSRAKLIAHETSHMWFGDLVTMKWFNDVWMKEVFANFIADKIVNPAFPEINHDLLFVLNHYPNAYSEDRTRGTNPIRQKLDNLKNAGSLYGNIIYNKAPIMMRQLEIAIGRKPFQEGIQEYIKTYANGNADWNNLVKNLDSKTPLDMKKWSDVWVNQSGRPLFKDHITYDSNNNISLFEILQKAEDGSENKWPQTFDVAFIYPDSTHLIPINIKGNKTTLAEAKGLPKPKAIIYNYNGFGYGVFPLDQNNLNIIPEINDDVARGYSYINSYEKTLNGNIDPLLAFNLYKKGLISEKNELIVNLISREINSLFWKYFTDKERKTHQKELEDLLFSQLQTELPPNIKKTLFRLFSSIAYSELGKERLFEIWNKKAIISNLKLNEDDYTEIAMNLAVYEHEKTDEIIEETKASITNPDKLRRFEFLLPSLSSDEAIRDTFFQSLKDKKNREKESWVLSASNNIHHPLRQKSAIKHLKTSLELLKEIQQTGDIFFPKSWLNSTIGNYSSKEAYDILENFLSSHPDFSPILKKKLLQATDNLYRAQGIRKK